MVYKPTATYRLQLSHEFTLMQLQEILKYLHKLGVSTVYAAPMFAAQKGSTHGYDVTNPEMLNSEIGNEEQFNSIAATLKEQGMGWLQDIVPNHMAYGTENQWLMDVLEKGSHSKWYTTFDFWNELNEEGKEEQQFMAPFLGSPIEECLQKNEIKLVAENGNCFLDYFGNRYPLSLPSYLELLNTSSENKLQKALTTAIKIEREYSDDLVAQFKKQLKDANAILQEHCASFGGKSENMKLLLHRQYYRLCWWKETERNINYRRFFTVNDLICLNIQKPEVFNNYHNYLKELIKDGKIQGLRIDHIDGLYDPAKYLEDLRFTMGEDIYLLVEKILETNEVVDQEWPIQGTTGYDFLSLLNALFVNTKAEEDFTSFYSSFSGLSGPWEDLVWNNKKLILHERMQGEFENLLKLYYKLGLPEMELPEEAVSEALSCLLLAFPVYRTYINKFPFSKTDQEILQQAFQKAGKRISPNGAAALESFKHLYKAEAGTNKEQEKLQFIQRIQQISGPLEAKGLEDTTFYSYNRLTSLNEVGNQPQHFGITPERFHQKMQERQENLPLTLNATATHDTKRGEDARQRLNAISEIPAKWRETVMEWHKLNLDKKERFGEQEAPDKNDEYFIYQSLLAFYPAEGRHENSFVERLKQYLEKAMREAKRHSSWSSPNAGYEKATSKFIEKILADEEFMDKFSPIATEVTRMGTLKSLSQLALKMMAPGIPDVYQGTELPDFSMVDPDNRRPVNYKKREEWLDKLLVAENNGPEQLYKKLMEHLTDGRMKLYLTHKFLKFRKEEVDLCNEGRYIPIQIEGKQQDKIIAFARLHQGRACLVAAPIFPTLISDDTTAFLESGNWQDTFLVLPGELQLSWVDTFTKKPITAIEKGKVALSELLGHLPIALLKGGQA